MKAVQELGTKRLWWGGLVKKVDFESGVRKGSYGRKFAIVGDADMKLARCVVGTEMQVESKMGVGLLL